MPTRKSIANIPEAELIDLLIRDPQWHSRILEIHGIQSGSLVFQRVSLSGLPGGPRGDVDILLIVPGRPDLATAIEIKRIKVSASSLRTQQPNKLRELKRGVQQVNMLAKIGFSQVYFFVFVVVDSREQNAGRISFDGLPAEMRRSIVQVILPSGLEPRVGLIHYEFVQSMDDEPLKTGAFSGDLIRLAEPITQPSEVTAWVHQRIASGERTILS